MLSLRETMFPLFVHGHGDFVRNIFHTCIVFFSDRTNLPNNNRIGTRITASSTNKMSSSVGWYYGYQSFVSVVGVRIGSSCCASLFRYSLIRFVFVTYRNGTTPTRRIGLLTDGQNNGIRIKTKPSSVVQWVSLWSESWICCAIASRNGFPPTRKIGLLNCPTDDGIRIKTKPSSLWQWVARWLEPGAPPAVYFVSVLFSFMASQKDVPTRLHSARLDGSSKLTKWLTTATIIKEKPWSAISFVCSVAGLFEESLAYRLRCARQDTSFVPEKNRTRTKRNHTHSHFAVAAEW